MAEVFNFDSNIRKALIVVAHADDETIFMGGTILKNKDWEWYLYVLAYRNNKDLDKSQLDGVIKAYQAFGVKIHLCKNIMEIESTQDDQVVGKQDIKIKDCIEGLNNYARGEIKPDIILTHNKEGEYGHPQHKKVNQYVNTLFTGNTVWEFIAPCATNVVPQPFKKYVITIRLNQDDLDKKRKIYSHYQTEQSNWINHLSKIMLYQFGSGPEVFTKD
jgi:predicted peroxiredoxin